MSELRNVIQRVYNRTIRPYLPRKLGCYNGVAVRDLRLFDRDRVVPDFEQEAVDAIHRRVDAGDTVGIVGGGRGTTTVHAARAAQPGGSVVVYEAARDRIPLLKETVALNEVADHVEVREGIVGPAELVWGDASKRTIDPADLPTFDVLELDCEGAELAICEHLQRYPSDLIVEVHPELGVSPTAMEEWLDETGYTITYQQPIPEQGIVSLTATRDPAEVPATRSRETEEV